MPAFTVAGLGSAGRRTPGVPARASVVPKPAVFGPGTSTFKVPLPGQYAFRLWGAGQNGDNGNSGAYAKKVMRLAGGDTVAITVGFGVFAGVGGATTPDYPIVSTTVSFSNGLIVTAGVSKSQSAAALASGGDINISGYISGAYTPGRYDGTQGVAAGSARGGAGAPGDEVMSGGGGGDAMSASGVATGHRGSIPGGAGGVGSASNGYQSPGCGGDGLVIVTFEGA